MKKQESLLSSTVILGVAAVLSKATVFFLMPFYTAYLTPADFGNADVLVGTALLLLPFVSLNVPEALFRFLAGDRCCKKEFFSAGVFLLVIGASLFFLLISQTVYSSLLFAYRWYLFFYVLASVSRSLLAHVLRAEGNYIFYAGQQVLCTLLTVLLQIFLLAVLQKGVGGYLLGVILADATVFFCLLFLLRPWRYFSAVQIKRGTVKKILRYSLPLMPTAVLWWVTAISDRYILLHYHGAEITGLYAAASRIPTVLTFLIGVFLEAWQYAAISTKEEARALRYGRIYSMLLPVAIIGAAGVLSVAYPLVLLIYAPEYAGAVVFVPFLTLASLFAALSSFLGSIYVVRLKSLASLFTALCGALLNVAFNFLLIPRFGGLGAAFATLVAYFTVFLVRTLHSKRYLHFSHHTVKFTVSALFLWLAAFAVMRGGYVIALLPAILSPLPFFVEIWEGVSLLLEKTVDVWKKRQKRTKGY